MIGCSLGGWIAAEMATMSPQAFRRLVLVGAMGVKPKHGEILDQALVSYIAYVRAGFEDQSVFDRVYGADLAGALARHELGADTDLLQEAVHEDVVTDDRVQLAVGAELDAAALGVHADSQSRYWQRTAGSARYGARWPGCS